MFKKKEEEKVEDEILSKVEEGQEQGYIQEAEAEMISNILEFDDKKVREIMTSRSKVFAVQGSETAESVLRECLSSGFSRYPVYEEDVDHIVGVLHIKDLVEKYLDNPTESVASITEKAMFIHPTYDISKLLQKMQAEKVHMAVVVDEYGQTDGIVTLEDIIEEIVGNIYDEHDTETKEISEAYDDSYMVDGLISLNDLSETLDDVEFPDIDVETLNGFLLYKLGRFPKDDENIKIDYGGYSFEPVEIEDRMIRKVRIRKTEEMTE